ncbi:hypothetical protein HanHA300_Chr13g0496691 [Helianthus annuus]|nr:hypothetical protein HanHA300_Chr13g0496691 [Helianthus annuus]KAJ0499006.1 hypothetical protein HanHA89_Chr13g0529341 [Helianthus annuus]KAJ0665020.1 hypothetical protein HanLR1_Chr13g0499371 [Helianthus annuus]
MRQNRFSQYEFQRSGQLLATTNNASERRRRLGLPGCPEEVKVFRRGGLVQHGIDDNGV